MKYCNKCLTTNLRPNAQFNAAQICIACEFAGSTDIPAFSSDKNLRDLRSWISRLKKEHQFKRYSGQYDCIVGVSGGKDSTRQAHWVRDRLGMNPLLVCGAYPPKQMTSIGAENISNLISMGFDLEIVCPAPKSAARLSLEAFRLFGNVCKSTELALFSVVPNLALEKKIQFIFWGENPALQVGDRATLGLNPFDGSNLRSLNTLSDGGIEWVEKCVGRKSAFYRYPSAADMNKKGINIIYLGPAWDDWSTFENASYAALQGLTLQPENSRETGDISGASMLDEEFTNINMMLRYFKFGFGRATDDVNEAIRSGRLSRTEGVKIAQEFDGVCSDGIIERYCEYTEISVNEFWEVAISFVNKDLFSVASGQRPKPRFTVGQDFD